MSPLAQTDGHDAPWVVGELVPRFATVVDEIVVRFEDAIREPVVAHELPDVLDGVEFWAFGRQSDDGDVGGDDQPLGHVPSGLIDEQDCVGSRRNRRGNLRKVQVHRLGVAKWQDQGHALALFRADRTEDVGGGSTLISGRSWAGAALGPPPGDFVLLADACLVLEPYFYLFAVDTLFARDRVEVRWEVFLNSSMAPSAWA